MEFTKESQCYQYNKISGYLHALVTQAHHKKSKKMTDIPESPNRLLYSTHTYSRSV